MEELKREVQKLSKNIERLDGHVTEHEDAIRTSRRRSNFSILLALAILAMGVGGGFVVADVQDSKADTREVREAVGGLCPVLQLFVVAIESNPNPTGQTALQVEQRRAVLPILKNAVQKLGC